MSNGSTNQTVDAYRSIIDFNKTILTISSTVLSALIAYVIYQNIDLNFINYLSIGLIVLAIFFSLFGFGGAIETIKDSKSRPPTVFISNASGYILIVGIILTLFSFNHRQERTVDDILNKIETTTTTLNKRLSSKTMKSLEYDNEKYTIIYQIDSVVHTVLYETSADKIILIK